MQLPLEQIRPRLGRLGRLLHNLGVQFLLWLLLMPAPLR